MYLLGGLMIGLILLPFYIFFNVWINKYIVNWLGLVTKKKLNGYKKNIILIIQISKHKIIIYLIK